MEKFDASYWTRMRWGSLRLNPEQVFPDSWSKGSGKKLLFDCTCGRSIVSAFYTVNSATVSCGKCTFQKRAYWIAQKWGTICLDPNEELPEEWGPSSRRKFKFLCDCGKDVWAVFYKIPNSCGRCSFLPKEHWLSQRWGSLRLDPSQDLPQEWGPKTNRKFSFLCDCGNSTTACFENVTYNHTQSCGSCSDKPKEFWLAQRWGNLQLITSQPLRTKWGSSTPEKLWFQCSCGKKVRANFVNVTAGRTQTCNRCNFQSRSFWLDQHWGSLRLSANQTLPEEWAPWTEQKYLFLCICGRTIKKEFGHIYSGNWNSCGMCDWKGVEYWLTQRWGKLRLDPDQCFRQKEWGTGYIPKLQFLCDCGKKKKSMLSPVLRGYTKSCGCLRPGITELSPAYKIYEFVRTLDTEAEFSHWLKNPDLSRMEYDIYAPSKKLAIEYHGLVWHSEQFNQQPKKDYQKLVKAKSQGDRLIQIYADEWESKQAIIKAQLQDILAPEKAKRIKPIFSVEIDTNPEVRAFLDAHHYLGAASGCVTIVARHREAIVGAWVFMKRETGVVLWHRACWDRAYKSWNPHEKALKLALPALREMGFTKIVTFSDNRFHTGELYEKLGFKFEEELKPDYGYTNGIKRVSKYNLRVPAGVNEVESAKVKGWYRIWDSGKRRYSLNLITLG